MVGALRIGFYGGGSASMSPDSRAPREQQRLLEGDFTASHAHRGDITMLYMHRVHHCRNITFAFKVTYSRSWCWASKGRFFCVLFVCVRARVKLVRLPHAAVSVGAAGNLCACACARARALVLRSDTHRICDAADFVLLDVTVCEYITTLCAVEEAAAAAAALRRWQRRRRL